MADSLQLTKASGGGRRVAGERRGGVGGDADPLHAGGLGGLDAGVGVFEDEAIGGGDVEEAGGGEEGFGIGFAVGVVLGGDDGLEAVAHVQGGEGALDGEAGRAADDGHGEVAVLLGDVRGDVRDGVDLVEGGVEHGEIELLFAVNDRGWVHGVAEALVEHLDGAGEGDAAPLPEEIFGEVGVELAGGLLPGGEVQRHGIGDGAVEVEEVGAEVAGGDGDQVGHTPSVGGGCGPCVNAL